LTQPPRATTARPGAGSSDWAFATVVPFGNTRISAKCRCRDAALYEAQAVDIHDQGRYLVEKKYRHLRLAYMFLGLAFLAGAVAQTIATLV